MCPIQFRVSTHLLSGVFVQAEGRWNFRLGKRGQSVKFNADSHGELERIQFDFVDLKLFVSLAASRNLTRAAERTNMSLSAASTRIKNLEEKKDVKLVNRNKQGDTLTSQGETFLHDAGLSLQQSIAMQEDMQEHSTGMRGHLRVFANHNAGTVFLPRIISRFLLKHPQVSIGLQEHISQDVIKAVQPTSVSSLRVCIPAIRKCCPTFAIRRW